MPNNIFADPIATNPPPSFFPRREHPVPNTAVYDSSRQPSKSPTGTNKFYSNLYLGSQTQPVWPLPYVLRVDKALEGGSWGVHVTHAEESQFVLGPDRNADPVTYYIAPTWIKHLQFSGREFDGQSVVTVDSARTQSINLNLLHRPGDFNRKITFPLVQGMGLVTAYYNAITPVFNSVVGIRSFSAVPTPRGGLQKWEVVLEEDGGRWFVYACPDQASRQRWLEPSLEPSRKRVGFTGGAWTGFIQIGKVGSGGDAARVLDDAAGAFAIGAQLWASVAGERSTYGYRFSRFGTNNGGALLMYALPHHMASLDPGTAARKRSAWLRSTTKGVMTAVVSDEWTMQETLPTHLTWVPSNSASYSSATLATIRAAAIEDMAWPVDSQSNLPSMYFAGKALARYAQTCLVLAEVVRDATLARQALATLVSAFDRFASNRQIFPLVYDTTWKGVVSSGALTTGNAGEDFGGTYYNDHHFHYGYHIYASAVITYLDQKLNHSDAWFSRHREWVLSLVRDVANTNERDSHFPVARAFDWFHGHSWAKGLFESADGKDQESSSEDVHFAYALYLFGRATNMPQLRDLGLLKLAVLKRTLNAYFLLHSSNQNHPRQFIRNKVTGILFENKVDHTTYFGARPEYIQGIHMLPLTPAILWIRDPRFVREEWDVYFSGGRGESVEGGWRSIVMGVDGAVVDPRRSWDWFSTEARDPSTLDGGLGRSWGLTCVAGELAKRGAKL